MKTSNESTIFRTSEKKKYASVETNTKIPSNQRISSIRRCEETEEDRPVSGFDAKKPLKTVQYESDNRLSCVLPETANYLSNYHSFKYPEQRRTVEKEQSSCKPDKRNEIDQDLESINAILDRYGISPISRLSLGNKSGSYYLKLGKEQKEQNLIADPRKRTFALNNKPGASYPQQGTDKNSYLLSQDFELARPFELEPNYSPDSITTLYFCDFSQISTRL